MIPVSDHGWIIDTQYKIQHSGYQAAPGGPCGLGGCAWVAGMMYVHEEDLDTVAESRPVECESCERVYDPARRDEPGYLRPEIEAPGASQWAAGHDPECTGCKHDCPWQERPMGAPFCTVCDDHHEARGEGWTGVSGLPWGGTG